MRLLLDTHAFLWFSADDPALSRAARSRIEDPRNEKFLSVASAWEMAIKLSLGKLALQADLTTLLERGAAQNGIGFLDVRPEHAVAVASLPFHHRDPFDRMLIAQAATERMAIVGRDGSFDAYPVRRIW